MSEFGEKPSESEIEKDFSLGHHYEKIHKLLQNEKEINEQFRECLEILSRERQRRIALGNEFMEDLEKVMKIEGWFIAPMATTRTDFGHTSDLEIIVVSESSDISEYDFMKDDIMVTPFFVDPKTIDKFPDMKQWFLNKMNEEKPAGNKEVGEVDVSALEDKVRYSLSRETRERIREFRLKLGQAFIKEAKENLPIISAHISGSTVENPEKFSVNSDLDLEILTNPKSREEEQEIFSYLHHFMRLKYADDYDVKVCFSELSIETIKRFSKSDEKMKAFFEKKFGVSF